MSHRQKIREPESDLRNTFAILSRKQALLCAFAIVISALPSCAQKIRYAPSFGVSGKPSVNVVHNSTFDSNPTVDEESCFPWKLSAVQSTTVSVTRLKIPSKAKGEFEMACDAFNKNKFAEAEQHAQRAVAAFQDYLAGWLMLGVIFEAQHKAQEAGGACSHATAIDANYLPAYLCAAEVSVRTRDWQQVLNSADSALSLKSEGDPYASYYRAMAYLHLNNLVEAKKTALQAIEIDVHHIEPSIYFLLAEIYDREGDSADAIAQVREFLNHHPDRQQEDIARQFLAKLESRQQAAK